VWFGADIEAATPNCRDISSEENPKGMTDWRRFKPGRLLASRRMFSRLLLAFCLAVPLGGFLSLDAIGAPSAKLWSRWQAHDPTSTLSVDHTAWDRLLRTYVLSEPDGINRFAYGKVTAADRAALDAYIATLSRTAVSQLNRAEQRAFWINLYNALTVQVVLAHYPVDSIRDIDISPGLFADGPWGRKLVEVEGEPISLDDIEHRILRPIWRDPRIHYAVNCASLGCPNLQPEAFTAANSETLLDRAAHAYVNHPRGARVENGKLIVSSIYVWFAEDFGSTDAAVIDHLRRYADADLLAALKDIATISGHAYDWRLNEPANTTG
jgi:hypothetical protein